MTSSLERCLVWVERCLGIWMDTIVGAFSVILRSVSWEWIDREGGIVGKRMSAVFWIKFHGQSPLLELSTQVSPPNPSNHSAQNVLYPKWLGVSFCARQCRLSKWHRWTQEAFGIGKAGRINCFVDLKAVTLLETGCFCTHNVGNVKDNDSPFQGARFIAVVMRYSMIGFTRFSNKIPSGNVFWELNMQWNVYPYLRK